MIATLKILIFCLPFIMTHSLAQNNEQPSPLMAVHLLDYLAKDYAGAVSAGGQVLSHGEYDEQVEFSLIIEKTGNESPLLNNVQEVKEQLSKLKDLIAKKAPPSEVVPLARAAQATVLKAAKIEITPTIWPKISEGKKLYEGNCVSCHGANGDGDGPSGKGLDPQPANFLDHEAMKGLSAFQAYNTIRLGVPGTGMASFSHLSDHEIWSLSFYVLSLRHPINNSQKVTELPLNLQEISSLSDAKLIEALPGRETEKAATLATIRNYEPTSSNGQEFLKTMSKLLDDSLSSYGSGDSSEAKNLAIRAYLEGFEPLEPRIKANDGAAVLRVEEKMAQLRSSYENHSDISLSKGIVENIKGEISGLEKILQDKTISPSVAFSAAFFILLREGFEAVLIILTLLSIIKAFGSKTAALYVHGGWVFALFVGFLTWFGVGGLLEMSGASRETMEAVVSALAVVVLLYFGFWLHRQSEIGRWKVFIEKNVHGALENKNLWGLATISFFAVFREAIETVLFLKAIWFDANQQARNSLTSGVFVALALIFALSFFALKFSRKIPIRQLFTVSSLIMCALSFILTGKAIHAFQEAGYVSITLLPTNLNLELAGIYSTAESSVAQLLVLAVTIGLWHLGSKPSQVQNIA